MALESVMPCGSFLTKHLAIPGEGWQALHADGTSLLSLCRSCVRTSSYLCVQVVVAVVLVGVCLCVVRLNDQWVSRVMTSVEAGRQAGKQLGSHARPRAHALARSASARSPLPLASGGRGPVVEGPVGDQAALGEPGGPAREPPGGPGLRRPTRVCEARGVSCRRTTPRDATYTLPVKRVAHVTCWAHQRDSGDTGVSCRRVMHHAEYRRSATERLQNMFLSNKNWF